MALPGFEDPQVRGPVELQVNELENSILAPKQWSFKAGTQRIRVNCQASRSSPVAATEEVSCPDRCRKIFSRRT